jgi:hypothetical protein
MTGRVVLTTPKWSLKDSPQLFCAAREKDKSVPSISNPGQPFGRFAGFVYFTHIKGTNASTLLDVQQTGRVLIQDLADQYPR